MKDRTPAPIVLKMSGQIPWLERREPNNRSCTNLREMNRMLMGSRLEAEHQLNGVVSTLSLLSVTNTASSFAGFVPLALRLMRWTAPGSSKKLSPAW